MDSTWTPRRSLRLPTVDPTSRTFPTATFATLRDAGRLSATTDFSLLEGVDTINICVPTPLRKTKDPDMSYVVSAVETIAAHLRPGMLVILESTTYPGTTDELVRPILETGGLVAGQDFFLAFSPERVDPGNPRFNTRNVPKVVGGISPTCASLAAELYGAAIETVIPVSSPRVAEMVKLLENTFRAVNIGLVNEIALMCDALAIDVWEVVDAAATKPFGFMPFYPGPGLGGHCIPIDPFYLSWKAKQSGFEARFIELAGQVNGSMPQAVVQKIADALNTRRKSVNGARILIAGVAYKRDVGDMRESPALDVMHHAPAARRRDQLHRSLRAEAGSRPWRVRPRVDRSPRRGRRCVRSTRSRSSPITRCSTTARSSSTRISWSTPATRSKIGRRTSSGWAHQHMRTPQRPDTLWAREHPSSRYEAGSKSALSFENLVAGDAADRAIAAHQRRELG